MRFLAPDFAGRLSAEALRELDRSDSTVMGLRPDYTVGYRNAAWVHFASANGAPELTDWNGTPITHVFAESVRAFYEGLFRRVQDTGEPADHEYDCSSPELYRRFRLRILPLPQRGLLLVHHLHVEGPHPGPVHPADHARYASADGIVTQCCHCRRTRRNDQADTWDWVPAYVARGAAEVSHGLCPPCFRHYYPELADLRDRRA